MRIQNRFYARTLLFAPLLCLGVASADPLHVAGPVEMQAAISSRVEAQASQRAAIQSLLARPEVQRLAADSGLDLVRAKTAAANLDGEELQRLSAQASALDAQLAGGDTLVIAGSTLIIILLIVLIILAV